MVYRLDRGGAARRAVAVSARGGTVVAPSRPESSRIDAPVIRQRLRNNCETASLQILLATVGVRSDQLTLQRRLLRSAPLDPIGTGPGRIWGDPERGFVGRPEGGGSAGGFGVYEQPIRSLASRYGRQLDDLTAQPAAAVYQRLRSGRAVMAWVGLSDGPYASWRSPRGRRIEVNFGEHAVVLTGIRRDGTLEVVNPLQGTLELWSPGKFETWWDRLDRRAVST